MSGDTSITVIGNLTADAELTATLAVAAVAAVANFASASTPRTFGPASGAGLPTSWSP